MQTVLQFGAVDKLIYVPGFQFSKSVLASESISPSGTSGTLCAYWLALWRTSWAWELHSVTPPFSPWVLVCPCVTTLGSVLNNRKQVLRAMKTELCWVHSIVFKVGLQYRIACHGETAAVKKGRSVPSCCCQHYAEPDCCYK